jgi:exodeoxyribonuclease V alpha subunit
VTSHPLTCADDMLATLEDWADAGWIRWLDLELARFIYTQSVHSQTASPALLLATALCSHQNGHGHACLDLAHCLDDPQRALSLPPDGQHKQPKVLPVELLAQLNLSDWLAQLENPLLIASGKGDTPLVLPPHHSRPLLYLRRYWQYEQIILKQIRQRLTQPVKLDDKLLRHVLDQLFDSQPQRCDWQKIACAIAAANQFSIITGGPGTGKTTTVVRLLAALSQLQEKPEALRIRLAAPTGKAAVRLSESISNQVSNLPVNLAIPDEVTTIHRLLGSVPGSRHFRHHAGKPLAADVVVIDEASMVDIELMAQLLEALPDECRLILLGDKDQLASVEAGAVLGSLCERADRAHYTQQTIDWLLQVSGQTIPTTYQDNAGQPLEQAITMLRYSHRFGQIPGIGALASAVNQQSVAIGELFRGAHEELQHLGINTHNDPALRRLVMDKTQGYGHFLDVMTNRQPTAETPDMQEWNDWAAEVLEAFSRFRILAAIRSSEWGTEALNQQITKWLQSACPGQESHSATVEWYSGRAIILTRNDYNLRLMNGDTGITLPCPDARGNLVLKVAFPVSSAERVRWISPARLQSCETAFVMTVHKSQGSEFAHTALMLPDFDSPVLTRELVYTAVTRASERFTLIARDSNILHRAVSRRVFRTSGLLANQPG